VKPLPRRSASYSKCQTIRKNLFADPASSEEGFAPARSMPDLMGKDQLQLSIRQSGQECLRYAHTMPKPDVVGADVRHAE
jgi:hypothetical protein